MVSVICTKPTWYLGEVNDDGFKGLGKTYMTFSRSKWWWFRWFGQNLHDIYKINITKTKSPFALLLFLCYIINNLIVI